MKKRLTENFFKRQTEVVAEDLLGAFLIRKDKEGERRFVITEVEIYDGFEDTASHASKGKTERTKIMFDKPGVWYIYLIYGMYYMLNVVTREAGYPAAILIRGTREISGPGRLTRDLTITKELNGTSLEESKELWIEGRKEKVHPKDIYKTSRIGVTYAGEYWANKKWRFILK